MVKYATGNHAFGFCDRTGFRYKLKDLKQEYVGGNRTGFLVGKDVWDKDQGQNFQGRYTFQDAQALTFAMPDSNLAESRRMFSFNTVGNGNAGGSGNLIINGSVGSVTIKTS
mgnify:CR=1 FL=1